MRETKTIRCAIYTRKSTEYGLEQEFNSLDAQREAAEAYVKSQAHEGWRALPTRYDDGGISGATMDRPALQALLSDICQGRIDVVVVYKVDRLTRSLADFAKLVELFDEHQVSFVSVTQQFNTTNSMGRLTLNVLLSFAQFEREVTGERIRDKIAASKKKGMWVGGPVPLGYETRDKKLVVVEHEAEQVRFIFRRYVELGCLRALLVELEAAGIVSKRRQLADGRTVGGIRFYKGPLAYLLKNRVYIGEVNHRGKSYPGEHEPIVARELFDAVQAKLAAGARAYRNARFGSGSLLKGRIYDHRGNRMTPANAHKNGARYRYYVSSATMQGRASEAGSLTRVSAPDVERLVIDALRDVGAERGTFEVESVGSGEFAPEDLDLIERMLERVVVSRSGIELVLSHGHVSSEDGDALEKSDARQVVSISWPSPQAVSRREIVLPAGADEASLRPMRSDTHKTLLTAVAKARAWMQDLISGRVSDTNEIAEREGKSERYVRMVLPLAFLAPEVIEIAASDRLPEGWGVSKLISDLPASWSGQHAALGLMPIQ